MATEAMPPLAAAEATARDRRTEELFRADMLQNYCRTDRMFAVLMVIQFVAGILVAYWISPRTWAGTTSEVHPHVWAALVIGGLTNLFPAALAWWRPGEALTRHVVATGQVLTSALLIHLTGGRIETHFHVFGSLAFIAFYRDWKVLIPATVYVAADHFVRGIWFPQSVYGIIVPEPWRWLEHAFWVIFEDTFLIIAIRQNVAQAWRVAERETDARDARGRLQDEVREKSQALSQLEDTLGRLKEAQVQLVLNEKMAALGSLVAGVAHEINTPVGVGVTAASTLEAHTDKFRAQIATGTMRRADFEHYADIAHESSRIILRNLQRAADLIHSFKQVAVDQSSGERRSFALKAYIDEVLLSLRPQLKKVPHRLEVECQDLTLDSYPGALAQIVTNLISNSLIHGFEGPDRREPGTIRLHLRRDDDEVVLRYTDDGRGIAKEHLPRIFEPFFTTRRGSGGSGLGLHIVYNLAVQMLGGTIRVASEPGAGVEFTIRFPARRQALASPKVAA